jgi:hypothetical protein
VPEGKKYLDRALQVAPKVRAVYYEHARLNLRLDRLQDARADAEQALALPDPAGYIPPNPSSNCARPSGCGRIQRRHTTASEWC